MIPVDSANSSPFYYLGPEVEGAVDRVQSFTQRHRGVINGIILGSVAVAGVAVLVGAIMGVSQSPEAPETNNHEWEHGDQHSMGRELVCQVAKNLWESGECVLGNLSDACAQMQECLVNLRLYRSDEYHYATETIKNVCDDVVLKILNLDTAETFNLTPGRTLLTEGGRFQTNSSLSNYHLLNATSCDSIYNAEQLMPWRD